VKRQADDQLLTVTFLAKRRWSWTNLYLLIVGREFQMQAFAVNGDSQTGRSSWKTQRDSQFLLGHFIKPPSKAQQYLATVVCH